MIPSVIGYLCLSYQGGKTLLLPLSTLVLTASDATASSLANANSDCDTNYGVYFLGRVRIVRHDLVGRNMSRLRHAMMMAWCGMRHVMTWHGIEMSGVNRGQREHKSSFGWSSISISYIYIYIYRVYMDTIGTIQSIKVVLCSLDSGRLPSSFFARRSPPLGDR